MNILIVTEQFLFGGLETRIKDQIEYLKGKNCNCFLACDRYNGEKNFPVTLFSDIKMTGDMSIAEMVTSIDALRKIIRENNIDIVDIHPFNSMFLGVMAGKLENKIVITNQHSKYNFDLKNNDLFYALALAYGSDYCNCVSEETYNNLDGIIESSKKIIVRNTIKVNEKIKNLNDDNKKWALVSRLDREKVPAIKKIIANFEKYKLNYMEIIGDGTEIEDLKNLVNANKLSKKIIFRGKVNNVIETLINEKFTGVIGMGRCVLEAISLNLPAILIGENDVYGLIDEKMFDKAKLCNFSARNLIPVNDDVLINQLYDLNKDPKKYKIQKILKKKEFLFDENWNIYLEKCTLALKNKRNFNNQIYYEIYELLNNYNFRNNSIYNDHVFQDKILSILIVNNQYNKTIIDKILNNNKIVELQYKYDNLNAKYNDLNIKYEDLYNKSIQKITELESDFKAHKRNFIVRYYNSFIRLVRKIKTKK